MAYTQKAVEDLIRARYGARATLRYASRGGDVGQWWVHGRDNNLLMAALTLDELAARLQPATKGDAVQKASEEKYPRFTSWPQALDGGYLTIGMAATTLGVSESGVGTFIRVRKLPAERVKVNGQRSAYQWRIKASELEDWRSRNTWHHFTPGSKKQQSSAKAATAHQPRQGSERGAPFRVSIGGAAGARLYALRNLGFDVEAWVGQVVARAVKTLRVKVA